MEKARVGFNYLERHSSEFKIRITSIDTPPPEIKEIRDSVPHMDGDYDFTFIFGTPKYSNRKITIGCFILFGMHENMAQTQREITNWLYGKPMSDLYLDHQEGYIYQAKCTDIHFEMPDYEKRMLSFNIVFEAKPYVFSQVEEKEVI